MKGRTKHATHQRWTSRTHPRGLDATSKFQGSCDGRHIGTRAVPLLTFAAPWSKQILNPHLRIHMTADTDRAYITRRTSILPASKSFLRTCQHWFNTALSRLPFRRRLSPPHSPSLHLSSQTPERAPTPPPRPKPVIEERVVVHIQTYGPPASQTAAPITTEARPSSAPREHLENRRRELHESP